MRAGNAPRKGTEVFLQVGGLKIYAQVVWQFGEQCGLRFQGQIRDWEVELLHREASKGTEAKLLAAQKGGADDWAAGVAR